MSKKKISENDSIDLIALLSDRFKNKSLYPYIYQTIYFGDDGLYPGVIDTETAASDYKKNFSTFYHDFTRHMFKICSLNFHDFTAWKNYLKESKEIKEKENIYDQQARQLISTQPSPNDLDYQLFKLFFLKSGFTEKQINQVIIFWSQGLSSFFNNIFQNTTREENPEQLIFKVTNRDAKHGESENRFLLSNGKIIFKNSERVQFYGLDEKMQSIPGDGQFEYEVTAMGYRLTKGQGKPLHARLLSSDKDNPFWKVFKNFDATKMELAENEAKNSIIEWQKEIRQKTSQFNKKYLPKDKSKISFKNKVLFLIENIEKLIYFVEVDRSHFFYTLSEINKFFDKPSHLNNSLTKNVMYYYHLISHRLFQLFRESAKNSAKKELLDPIMAQWIMPLSLAPDNIKYELDYAELMHNIQLLDKNKVDDIKLIEKMIRTFSDEIQKKSLENIISHDINNLSQRIKNNDLDNDFSILSLMKWYLINYKTDKDNEKNLMNISIVVTIVSEILSRFVLNKIDINKCDYFENLLKLFSESENLCNYLFKINLLPKDFLNLLQSAKNDLLDNIKNAVTYYFKTMNETEIAKMSAVKIGFIKRLILEYLSERPEDLSIIIYLYQLFALEEASSVENINSETFVLVDENDILPKDSQSPIDRFIQLSKNSESFINDIKQISLTNSVQDLLKGQRTFLVGLLSHSSCNFYDDKIFEAIANISAQYLATDFKDIFSKVVTEKVRSFKKYMVDTLAEVSVDLFLDDLEKFFSLHFKYDSILHQLEELDPSSKNYQEEKTRSDHERFINIVEKIDFNDFGNFKLGNEIPNFNIHSQDVRLTVMKKISSIYKLFLNNIQFWNSVTEMQFKHLCDLAENFNKNGADINLNYLKALHVIQKNNQITIESKNQLVEFLNDKTIPFDVKNYLINRIIKDQAVDGELIIKWSEGNKVLNEFSEFKNIDFGQVSVQSLLNEIKLIKNRLVTAKGAINEKFNGYEGTPLENYFMEKIDTLANEKLKLIAEELHKESHKPILEKEINQQLSDVTASLQKQYQQKFSQFNKSTRLEDVIASFKAIEQDALSKIEEMQGIFEILGKENINENSFRSLLISTRKEISYVTNNLELFKNFFSSFTNPSIDPQVNKKALIEKYNELTASMNGDISLILSACPVNKYILIKMIKDYWTVTKDELIQKLDLTSMKTSEIKASYSIKTDTMSEEFIRDFQKSINSLTDEQKMTKEVDNIKNQFAEFLSFFEGNDSQSVVQKQLLFSMQIKAVTGNKISSSQLGTFSALNTKNNQNQSLIRNLKGILSTS